MRYRDILIETIATRPRDVRFYLSNRLKALVAIRTRLTQAAAIIKQNVQEGERTLNYCVRMAVPDEQKATSRELYRLEHVDLDRSYELENLQYNLETVQKYLSDRSHDFLKYVFSSLDAVQPVTDEVRAVIPLLAYAEAGFAEYGYKDGEDDPDYDAAKKLLYAYRLIAGCLPQIEALQRDIRSKLGALRDLMGAYDPTRYKPAHGDTEILYHATAFMTEIIRDGFQAEPPEGRRGLGNYGHQVAISFTHDLELARNIMRMLKEMWMIAHGQVTGSTIMRWAQAEGITDELRKSWAGWSSKPGPWTRTADPKAVGLLYRMWLTHTKSRVNPMITYPEETIEMLQTRALDDIGVLACTVRLEQDDDYIYAESEFRLPPDRVVSVKRQF